MKPIVVSPQYMVSALSQIPEIVYYAQWESWYAAFHQSMPPKSFLYALPYDLYEQRGLRRYGAHGTSVHYLVKRAAQMLNKPVGNVNLIVAHLGTACASVMFSIYRRLQHQY